MSTHCNTDIAIVGAGPAGLALAAEALASGASVALVDPDPQRPWTPTWCAFLEDLPAGTPVKQSWSSAAVHLDSGSLVDSRPYVQVDGDALQAQLRARVSGALHVHGLAAGRTDKGLRLVDGREIIAPRVVDCSGGTQVLGGSGRPTAYQTAWGLEIETDGHPWAPDQAVWMDLRQMSDPPTFLYVLPRDGTHVFVEETALAASPEVPLPLLEIRLAERLERLGVKIRSVQAIERCRIPLDMGEPSGPAFGAAAGMVHPATGYLLSRVLGGAADYATALLDGDPQATLARIRGGRARSLHLLGLDVLVRADGAGLARFFSEFFALPPAARHAFLSVRPQLLSTTFAMARMFLAAPLGLKRQLAAPLFTAREPLPEVACPLS